MAALKRYGVLCDVHANLPALEAVLDALDSQGVDAYLWGGDFVGYGPFPNECIDLIVQRGGCAVAGNHDLAVIGRLPDEGFPRLARTVIRWTRSVLEPPGYRFLSSLPRAVTAPGPVTVAHGSLSDPTVYTTSATAADVELRALAGESRDQVLVLGHMHRARAFAEGVGEIAVDMNVPIRLSMSRHVLVPGSVGQSRETEPLARFMILDMGEQSATFHAIPYDIGRCRRALVANGLSPDACHRPRPSRDSQAAVIRRASRFLGRNPFSGTR
jgi:predicted phosphodiesterase